MIENTIINFHTNMTCKQLIYNKNVPNWKMIFFCFRNNCKKKPMFPHRRHKHKCQQFSIERCCSRTIFYIEYAWYVSVIKKTQYSHILFSSFWHFLLILSSFSYLPCIFLCPMLVCVRVCWCFFTVVIQQTKWTKFMCKCVRMHGLMPN